MAVRLIDFAEKKCVGGSVFRLFNDLGEYYHGTKDICIWPNREPDPDYANSNTPSSGKQDSNHQMPRLQPLVDKYNRQQLPKVDWLDKLVFREIEQINEKEKQSGNDILTDSHCSENSMGRSQVCYECRQTLPRFLGQNIILQAICYI